MSIYYPEGDEFVRCLDARDTQYLTEGKLYMVLRRYNGEVTIIADYGYRRAFKEARFETVFHEG